MASCTVTSGFGFIDLIIPDRIKRMASVVCAKALEQVAIGECRRHWRQRYDVRNVENGALLAMGTPQTQ